MRNILIAFLAGVFGLQLSLQSQNLSLAPDGRQRDKDKPTVISSESMDIDSSKNIAVFIGNVKVDDQDLNITCHKMTIFLADAAAKKEDAPDARRNKEVSKIVCEGDVVIIRKSAPGLDGEEQKATAGKSDYDVKEGKIVLTDGPVLMQGDQRIQGEEITFWRDSERLSVKSSTTNPAQMKLKTDALQVTPPPTQPSGGDKPATGTGTSDAGTPKKTDDKAGSDEAKPKTEAVPAEKKTEDKKAVPADNTKSKDK